MACDGCIYEDQCFKKWTKGENVKCLLNLDFNKFENVKGGRNEK